MKTYEIKVTSKGDGMSEALDLTEKTGTGAGLDHKENLRLRLLAEELFGTMRSIAGDVEASYYLEYEGKSFDMHMRSEVELTSEMRDQFISVSSSGQNAAATSFMGKLRDMIATVMLSINENPAAVQMGLMSAGCPSGGQVGFESYEWCMNRYKDAIRDSSSEDAGEAWDELEKSIVANIADDISISIVGTVVDITIRKAF